MPLPRSYVNYLRRKIGVAAVFVGTTAPPDPARGDIWLDTSATPNVLRIRGASAWGILNDDGGAVIHAVANVPAGAAAGDYDGLFFVADRAYEVTSVTERHQTAGTDVGAVTLMVKKVPSGTAKASGTDILSAGISLKATVNTNQTGTLHGTQANLQLAAGNALALVTTGTLTAVDGVSVDVVLKPI